jgi:type II secretory pathway component PulC
LLLGASLGWLSMVCLEVSLENFVGKNRSRYVSLGPSASRPDEEKSDIDVFLASNPFKISPMPVLDSEDVVSSDETVAPAITGSLADAVIRWTFPGRGVLLEDQGKQRLVLIEESFDVYTLERVTYREATFRKDEERVVKELLFAKGTATKPRPAPAPRASTSGGGASSGAVIPPDLKNGTPGEVGSELVAKLVENPFDELNAVRLRPAPGGQGMQVQWIDPNKSILAKLGLQKGDVVHSINGIAFKNAGDIANSINSLISSNRFDVEVKRGNGSTLLQYVVR